MAASSVVDPHATELTTALRGVVRSLGADDDDARNAHTTQNELARLVCDEAQRWAAAQPALAWVAGWPPLLHPYGSTVSSLAQHGSDLDLTLLFETAARGQGGSWCRVDYQLQRSLITHLHRVFMAVRQSGDTRWISVEPLMHLRQPMVPQSDLEE